MTPTERAAPYAARLLVEWLAARFDVSIKLEEGGKNPFVAVADSRRLGLYAAPLWEEDGPWSDRLGFVAGRLDATGVLGPFLLWVPPGADVPTEEPDLSDFTLRVQAVAASLPPGGRAEVSFPVMIRLGKMADEGGYASVVGGLSRWWTRITENVQGTFHVDSAAVHRVTQDGDARERLWANIGAASHGIELGQSAEFEVEETWTLQRLPESERGRGFALIGSPRGVDPADGTLLRRVARRRLADANEQLDALGTDVRAVALVGSYEYAELEGISATVKALTPTLFSRLHVVCAVADGEVRPTFLPSALP